MITQRFLPANRGRFSQCTCSLLNPHFFRTTRKVGNWSEVEERKLKEAVGRFGKDKWTAISEYILFSSVGTL